MNDNGSNDSRYVRYKSKRTSIRHKGQVLPLAGEYRNRFFRCQNCGFIVDSQAVPEGGPDEMSGVTVIAYSEPSPGKLPNGAAIFSPTRTSVVTGGCPLCGTKNYR